MIRAIIFDCFGVIVTDALEALTHEIGRDDPDTARQITDIVIATNRALLSAQEGSEQIAALLGITYDEYRKRIADGEVKDQRLLNYIAGLRKGYKTAMLSNISGGGLYRRFTEDELAMYFDFVVASGDIGFAKPEAQAYEYTADGLGVRLDECVFLDDREEYCEAARGLGMQAIVYEGFEQAKTELERLLYNPER